MKIMEKLEGIDKPLPTSISIPTAKLLPDRRSEPANDLAVRTLQTISDLNNTLEDEIFNTHTSKRPGQNMSVQSKNYTTINEQSNQFGLLGEDSLMAGKLMQPSKPQVQLQDPQGNFYDNYLQIPKKDLASNNVGH